LNIVPRKLACAERKLENSNADFVQLYLATRKENYSPTPFYCVARSITLGLIRAS